MQLTSKLQYKRSEKGEFHDIAMRDLDETIKLILSYPWDAERSLASVELTCPSVTVEHVSGSYLKIGPYFSGKYSLYYLDTKRRVYLKTVGKLEEACEWVKIYFEQKGQLQGLDKYGFTISPYKHFETNSFEYTIDSSAISRFFRITGIITGACALLCFLKYIENPEKFSIGIPIVAIALLAFLLLPQLYLYYDYLTADKNRFLQISRGHNKFVFGTRGHEKEYSKLDINSIDNFVTTASKSPWSDCEIFVITFNNGEQIKFTSLLIRGNVLRLKFPDQKIRRNNKYFPTFQSV
ncbi:hypothetical protein ACXZ1K_08010 [Pedobacter sp. PWIIR3]